MDLSIISLIVASLSALGTIVSHLHLKHCKSGCCESDCYKGNSTLNTPVIAQPKSWITDILLGVKRSSDVLFHKPILVDLFYLSYR